MPTSIPRPIMRLIATVQVILATMLAACAPNDEPSGALPTVLPGTPLWTGDFETGTLAQWENQDGGSGVQTVAGDRIRVVDDPVRQGEHAARFEVRQRDSWRGSSGNRADLLHWSEESEGDERWYEWSTLFAPDFPNATDGFQLFTSWHAHSSGSQAPLTFFADGDEIGLKIVESDANRVPLHSMTLWRTDMDRGAWHDFRLHVKWSADPEVGFVELWHDGELVVPRTHVATMIPDGTINYLKQGYYRSEGTAPTGVLYHDAMRMTEVLTSTDEPLTS